MALKGTAVRSLKWSMVGEVSAKLISPIIIVVLARILTPEDFGVVAAATVVTSFFQVIWDGGLSKTLIQKQDRVIESANVVFWCNLSIALLLSALLVVFSASIASFFNDERIIDVAKVLALLPIFGAFGSVQSALFQRNFEFKKLFFVRLATTMTPALASIPLAVAGAGYWALVAGAVTGQFLQTVTLYILSDWRPTTRFDWRLAAELWRFGRWVMLSALLAWFYSWSDAVVVGHFLNTGSMGLYRTGNTLVIIIFGLVFTPLLPVLYSTLSKMARELEPVRRVMLLVVKTSAIIGMPMAFGLLIFRDQVAGLAFGDTWSGVETVIGLLALAHGFSWLVGANGEAYRAIGKPQLESITGGAMLLVYVIGYLVAIQYGLLAFVVARVGLSLSSLLLHVYVLSRSLHIRIWEWTGSVILPLLVSLTAWLLIELTGLRENLDRVGALGLAVALLGTYILIIRQYENRFWRWFVSLVAEAFLRQPKGYRMTG